MANLEKATFAAGCFWCVEAVFLRLKGVQGVASGYVGGTADTANYKAVCGGDTGHAEVIQISFDPDVISFEQLLEVLWTAHDPTTLNRQGNDIGTQYRSAIFYHDEAQQLAAKKSISEVAAPLWDRAIVTEVSELKAFYPAEDYHQNYFANNPTNRYCNAVINPKLVKLRKNFAHLLKVQ